MDFLDPAKERMTRIALFLGYGLVALAIGITSIILLYSTDGYCIDGTGTVDRCGLVFMSSQPSGASVHINGRRKSAQTNTKFNLQSGSYAFRLTRDGYRDWQRNVDVLGGDVQRFDYPFLFPTTLKTTTASTFSSAVTLATQSPDRRWLLVTEQANSTVLKRYDLKDPARPVTQNLTLPTSIVTAGDGVHTWKLIEWSNDNRHVVLQHGYVTAGAAAQEYIMVDRQNITESRNLTRELKLAATDELTLFNKKPTFFYVYSTTDKTLHTAALEGDAPTSSRLESVIAYKTFGDDTVLYVTDTPPNGKKTDGFVSVVLQQGSRSIVLRQLPTGAAHYLLDIAQYGGDWYAVLGADTQKGVYIYQNPFDQKLAETTDLPVATRFLKVAEPQYVAFSAGTQFILAQNGQHFAVYDAENDRTYAYEKNQPLDSPQQHAVWMDGNRILYISGGKVYVFDYDGLNSQLLQAALSDYQPFFASNFEYVFNLQRSTSGTPQLASTALRVEK